MNNRRAAYDATVAAVQRAVEHEQDDSLFETVKASLLDDPGAAPQWIALMLASIADTMDDIAMALENRTSPRRRRQ